MTNNIENIMLQHKEMLLIADDIYQLERWYRSCGQEIRIAMADRRGRSLGEASEKIAHMLGKISEELEDVAHEILMDAERMENLVDENGDGMNG